MKSTYPPLDEYSQREERLPFSQLQIGCLFSAADTRCSDKSALIFLIIHVASKYWYGTRMGAGLTVLDRETEHWRN